MYYRDTIDNILVDEDQEVPEAWDSSLRQSYRAPERSYDLYNFRAVDRPEAALEDGLDALEDKVAGLLHFEGEGVAIEPGNDEEKDLVEVKEERKVGRNN